MQQRGVLGLFIGLTVLFGAASIALSALLFLFIGRGVLDTVTDAIPITSEDTYVEISYPVLDGRLVADAYTPLHHYGIWGVVKDLYPEKYVARISGLIFESDGRDEILGEVRPDPDDLTKTYLVIDPKDAFDGHGQIRDNQSVFDTVMHELAHIIAADPSQVVLDQELVNAFYSGEDVEAETEAARLACTGFFIDLGCAYETSYLAQFVSTFWTQELLDEGLRIWNETETWDEYYEATDAFYYDHYDDFVTSYAATNPHEDFAESFMYYLLYERPESQELIWQQKVEFFDQFPEMREILANIDRYLLLNEE